MPLFLGGFRFRLNFYDASDYIQAHKYFHYMVNLPQIVRRIFTRHAAVSTAVCQRLNE